MNLYTKSIPLSSLPYDNIDTVAKMIAKLYEKSPFLPLLSKVEKEDSLIHRTLDNIPGVKIHDKKVVLKTSSNHYKQGILKLDKAFINPTPENLEEFAIKSPFLEKFFQLIKKFKSPNAIIHLLGPFSISQILQHAAEEQILTDKSFRKLFVQSVCVKALWIIAKIKEINPETTPVIILEEPLYSQFGIIKRENEDITVDLVTTLFTRVIEKLKEAGAIVGIQCFEKCDWKIPMNAGVDIISFDAYNNPNNLNIIPEKVTEFLERGGKINWGIVPVMNETMVKSLNISLVLNRLLATMQGLVIAGVSANDVYNSALVSSQGEVDHLPLIFAEKANILSVQLAKKIPVKS